MLLVAAGCTPVSLHLQCILTSNVQIMKCFLGLGVKKVAHTRTKYRRVLSSLCFGHTCFLFGLQKEDTFCVLNQLKQAPQELGSKSAAAGASDALPLLPSDVKARGNVH